MQQKEIMTTPNTYYKKIYPHISLNKVLETHFAHASLHVGGTIDEPSFNPKDQATCQYKIFHNSASKLRSFRWNMYLYVYIVSYFG